MSPVFLDCSVACLALALCETSTVNKCQVGGVESVGDKEVPVSSYSSHSCQGSYPAARFALG